MSTQYRFGGFFFLSLVLLSFSTTNLAQEQEPNDTCATAQDLGTLPIPTQWSGNLNTPPEHPDVDFFRIQLADHAGTILGVDLKGQASGNGSLSDPLVGVFDSSCTLSAINDDLNGVESRVLVPIPADGVLIIAATSFADWNLAGNGDSGGSYLVALSQVTVAGSISGRVIDAESGQPLPGSLPPYSYVDLLLCRDESFCDWVNGQPCTDDGRFAFYTDYEGNPLPKATYTLQVWADGFHSLDLGALEVDEETHLDLGDLALSPIPAVQLTAAVLPTSRSTQVGTGNYVTAYASIINGGYEPGRGCRIAPITSVPADFFFGLLSGQPGIPIPANQAFEIQPYEAMHFVFGFLPSEPFQPTEIEFTFVCENSSPAPVLTGLNTFLLSASNTPGPDIVALAATIRNDGIVELSPYTQTGIFAVAAVNLGIAANLTATVDTGEHAVPVGLTLCQTNPQTGVCLNPATPAAGPLAFSIAAQESATFGVFVTGREEIVFDSLNNRIFVRFKNSQGQSVGSTSVAVFTGYSW